MGCMDHTRHRAPEVAEPLDVLDTRPSVSALLPDFLEYLRVEEQRIPETLLRYEHYIQAFIRTANDCPVVNYERNTVRL